MILVKPKKKLLDGVQVPVEIQLGTFAPVVIDRVHFSASARLVICKDKNTQQKVLNSNYQWSHPVPAGVLFEITSNVIWQHFDLTQPIKKADQRIYLIHPQGWEPVTLKSSIGVLYGILEARCGNKKWKADIEIELYTHEDTKKASQT